LAFQEEIRHKQKRLRQLISERDLSGLYIKKHSNFSWLTGGEISYVNFDTEMGRVGLLVTPDKAYTVCNATEAVRMEKESDIEEQGYEIRRFPWYEDREMAIVRELGGPNLGADYGFPGAVELSSAINSLRYSLTPWEVDRYGKLARLAAQAAEETLQTVRRGDKECAVVGRLAQRLWENRIDFVIAFCAADERIHLMQHPVTSEKKIEKLAMLSVNARKGGLLVSLNRFVQLGKVPESLRKQYRDVVYIDSVMMAATIPGRPAVEAFKAGLAAYKTLGYPDELELRHQGGAVGYAPREYRVNFATSEMIQENQGFAWNPSISGMKSEDTMLATSDGPVILSQPVVHPSIGLEVGGFSFRRPDILEL
jgi:Xaa-Pro dipeptidase